MEKTTIYIGNLPPVVDEESLKAAFIPFGEIKSIEIPIDQATEQQRGFAHIEFEDPEDCEHAIFNMNDSEFFGKVIKVSYAKPMKAKDTSKKSVWQSEDYLRTIAQPPPERAGLVRVKQLIFYLQCIDELKKKGLD